MGCKVYSVEMKMIQFREGEMDGSGPVCLCTFPHNWEAGGRPALSPATVQSMAMLGAAVAMVRVNAKAFRNKDHIVLPDALPEWIVKEIERNLPSEPLSRWKRFKKVFERWG